MIYHQSYVTSQHSLHLKNNKKIYDQLHKRDLRTFIIRKYQVQHIRSNSQEIPLTPKSIKKPISENKKKKQLTTSDHAHILNKIITQSRNKHTSPRMFLRNQKSLSRQLSDLEKDFNPRKTVYNPSSKKFKSQSPKHEKKTNTQQSAQQNKHNPEFESYLGYIHSEQKFFRIHMNFDSLRKMTPKQAWKQLDIKNAKLIEGMMKHIIENTKELDDDGLQNIKQICRIYFNNFEKVKMELILKQHYFKLFAFRLKPVFIIQRITFYFCYVLANKNIKSAQIFNSLRQVMENLTFIYNLIVKVIFSIQENKKGKKINQAFKILRSVGEVEKKIERTEIQIENIVHQQSAKQLLQVYKILKPYMVNHYTYEQLTKTQMTLSWKYLKVPPTPFLPSLHPSFQYTLVMDLDQTLVYFNQNTHILKYRPGLDMFFKEVKSRYEIVLFTASSKLYADTIVKEIESVGRIFNYRLYKEHLTLCNGRLIKDIRRLGRDMKKTLIIDDLAVNFSNCQDNGIEISSWTGNKKDKKLIEILCLLKMIADEKVEDIRQIIKQEQELIGTFSQVRQQDTKLIQQI